MTDKPWSTRIPAMIAKGAKLTADGDILGGSPDWVCLTTGEVALAKEAAKRWEDDCEWCQAHREPRFGCHAPPPALIAFTEKMEGL